MKKPTSKYNVRKRSNQIHKKVLLHQCSNPNPNPVEMW